MFDNYSPINLKRVHVVTTSPIGLVTLPNISVPLAIKFLFTIIVSPDLSGGFLSFDKPFDRFILIIFLEIVPFLLTLINLTLPLSDLQLEGPPAYSIPWFNRVLESTSKGPGLFTSPITYILINFGERFTDDILSKSFDNVFAFCSL